MNVFKSKRTKLKATRTFLKKGTCSRTFFYLLNKEFGHPKDEEERAIDPLAGGILQKGYQCGMLWGCSMAIGAEAFRRNKNPGKIIASSIHGTQYIMKSFVNQTTATDCSDISKTDFSNNWSFAKYMLSGKFVSCFTLAGKWAPDAIKAANDGLSVQLYESAEHSRSCASEVVKKMGGSEEESAMVAGFAGGLGLSGDACGALAAAIWKSALDMIRLQDAKPSFTDPILENIVAKFFEATDYKIECSDICGRKFKTTEEHTEFIKNGGCDKIINILAKS